MEAPGDVAGVGDSGSARRGAAPPERSSVRSPGCASRWRPGTPSSSTSTGSMVALARSCSNSESAIGTPAISAGPCSGTCTCTTGRGAIVGVSSSVSGCSHKLTSASAARCSKLSHA